MTHPQINPPERPALATGRCPLCRKPESAVHSPFCSATCRNRDLIAWLDERYVSDAGAAEDT